VILQRKKYATFSGEVLEMITKDSVKIGLKTRFGTIVYDRLGGG